MNLWLRPCSLWYKRDVLKSWHIYYTIPPDLYYQRQDSRFTTYTYKVISRYEYLPIVAQKYVDEYSTQSHYLNWCLFNINYTALLNKNRKKGMSFCISQSASWWKGIRNITYT